MPTITGISTSTPIFGLEQKKVAAFMQGFFKHNSELQRRIPILYDRTGIDKRYSCIPDFLKEHVGAELFSDDIAMHPNVDKRMELYTKHSLPLATESIIKVLNKTNTHKHDLTHLITISCTGMSAPGLDLQIIEALQLPLHIQRTSINFMGCYAGVHGLKQAYQIAKADPDAKIMLVSVELCSLHFQPFDDYDTITANAIFADGAAATIIVGDNIKHSSGNALSIHNFYSEVYNKGKQDMAWHISSKGFIMTLSSYIPMLIGESIAPLLNRAFQHAGITQKDIQTWAFHPGGKKIITTIQQSLNLNDNDVRFSNEVLKDYGNMSSATIFFVLEKIMQQSQPGYIFGAAFGPGLTMETFTFSQQ